jgi:rubrerythrin
MRTNDTDAKAATRAELKAQELPSRRYICRICGVKGRRSNLPSARLKDPVCPFCEKSQAHFPQKPQINI